MKSTKNELFLRKLGMSIYKFLPQSTQTWAKQILVRGYDVKHASQIYDQMLQKIDVGQLKEFHNAALPLLEKNPTAAEKYSDHKVELNKNIKRAMRLGWHTKKNMRILDIGCGVGWLIAIGKHLGHDVTGLDLPLEAMRENDRTTYTKIPEILQCSDRIHRGSINSFTPLPFSGLFDYITCIAVCFDGTWDENPWGASEWEFFLDDTSRLLAPGGKLYISLNNKSSIYKDLVYYDQATLELFESRGDVNKKKISIQKVPS